MYIHVEINKHNILDSFVTLFFRLWKMVITTLEDLQRLYPLIIPIKKVANINDKSTDQGLAYFCEALKSLGESWLINNFKDTNNSELPIPSCKDNTNMKELGIGCFLVKELIISYGI